MTEPFSVEIKGLEDMNKALTDLEKKQLPFATSRAINSTLFQMMTDMKKTIKRVFDSPTAFTVKSQLFKKSKKKDLTGVFWIKDNVGKGNPPARYLQAQIKGGLRDSLGVRRYKGFENLLRRRGILPKGWYVMPAKGARLTKFGNISQGMHIKILSDLRANLDSGVTSNRAAGTKGRFFVSLPKVGSDKFGAFTITKSKLPNGIYERKGKRGKPKAVFIFVNKRPRYRPRLPFDATVEKTFTNHFEKTFYKELDNAVRTAK